MALLAALLAPPHVRAADDLAKFMANEKALYGKHQLIAVSELLIRYHFRDTNDGFYIDVGCSDPRINSTTFYLEEHQNWSGMGIDPLEYLRPGWERFRPRSKFFAFAYCERTNSRSARRLISESAGPSRAARPGSRVWARSCPALRRAR